MNGLRVWAGPTLLLLALVLALVLPATEFLFVPWTVSGPSMEPTLLAGDRVIVDLWTFRQRSPGLDEIVLFDGPGDRPVPMVKRVATRPTTAPQRPRASLWPFPGDRPGLWLTGDARGRSRDSREFGPVPRAAVRGRVAFRYWPPSRAGSIPAPPPR